MESTNTLCGILCLRWNASRVGDSMLVYRNHQKVSSILMGSYPNSRVKRRMYASCSSSCDMFWERRSLSATQEVACSKGVRCTNAIRVARRLALYNSDLGSKHGTLLESYPGAVARRVGLEAIARIPKLCGRWS